MLTEKNLSLASKSALEESQERDLAIWWEAYRAALCGNDVAAALNDFESSSNRRTLDPNEIANKALADYRAKREELLK